MIARRTSSAICPGTDPDEGRPVRRRRSIPWRRNSDLTLGDIPAYLKGTGGGDLGSTPELQALVFGDAVLGEHKIGGPILLGDDKLILVKDLSHALPAPKPIASVHDLIVAALRKDLGGKAALAAADAAAKSLQSGKDFDAIAKELGVTADAARFVGRQDPSVPAQIRDAAFKAPKPAEHQPVYEAVRTARWWGRGAGGAGGACRGGAHGQAADSAQAEHELATQYGRHDGNAYVEQARKLAEGAEEHGAVRPAVAARLSSRRRLPGNSCPRC